MILGKTAICLFWSEPPFSKSLLNGGLGGGGGFGQNWPKTRFFRLVWSSTARIGTETPKTKISTNPGKVFPTGLYLGVGGFDHFWGGFGGVSIIEQWS